MDNDKWKDLCDKGFSQACLAYEKGKFDSCEEGLAICFETLFQLLKAGAENDDRRPTKIKIT